METRATARFLGILLLLAGSLSLTSLPAGARQEGDPYADRVVDFSPGNPANPELGNPEAALGPPDFDGEGLRGFLNLGVGGSVTVAFVDNVAVDGPGPDIRIHGDPDNDEWWVVEVSDDGRNFVSFDDLPEMADLDLADVGLPQARFVRLIDDGDSAEGISPGAELDAVEALNLFPPPQLREIDLRAVEPSQGQPGQELELILQGSSFDGAREVWVDIADIEVWDVWVESDEVVIAHVFIPEDAPPGPRAVEVVAIFGPGEEFAAGLERGFSVLAPEPPPAPDRPALYSLEPQEVQQDSLVEVTLFGENLTEDAEVWISGEGVELHEWRVEDPSRLIALIEVSAEADPGPRWVAVGTAGGQAELPDGLVVIGRPIAIGPSPTPPPPPSSPTIPPPAPTPTPPSPPRGDPLWPWAGAALVLVGLGATVGRALTLRTRLTWQRTAQLQWQLEAKTELPQAKAACNWACTAKGTTDLFKRWQVTALELTPLPLPSGKTPPVRQVQGQVLDRLTEAANPQYILEDEARTRQRLAPVVEALLEQILAWEKGGQTPASFKVDARLARPVKCAFKLYHCEQVGAALKWVDSGAEWKGTLHQPRGEYLGVVRGPTADESDFYTRAREELQGLLLGLVKGVRFKL